MVLLPTLFTQLILSTEKYLPQYFQTSLCFYEQQKSTETFHVIFQVSHYVFSLYIFYLTGNGLSSWINTLLRRKNWN